MVRQEKKYYSNEFKVQVVTAYKNSNESVRSIAQRFGVKRDTVSSWIYRGNLSSDSKKIDKLVISQEDSIKKEEMSPEAMFTQIRDLERQLSLEKMRSEGLSKMIEIAERELKIDIRKNTGAKRSLK